MKNKQIEDNKCRHFGCNCQKEPERDFCSDYCENAPVGDAQCGCGHSECGMI